ncbi:SDR family NAD(P)-dependent oxidoreductase [Guyparkeria hydrothermalis]|uniref:type I polyketide synthase n=1 Tax=Guyparkeria hydrothermalis TaxID=923 RepID=UPI002021FE50|nr:type I polyketide synthase [Guyparkeria hydrothermalis]MCL7745473.1 SDR family NAD(P)-dependent oxidoreductase [Guyparkeria hydrothermalis]
MATCTEHENQSDLVAIVGLAFRFPGDLSDPDALWSALMEGQDLVTEVPADRWATDTFQHDRRGEPGRSITYAAGVLSDIDQFDPGFFGISPREAEKLDPQQRLMLELAWHALEDAGTPASRLAGSDCGVYLGISGLDYGIRSLDDLSSFNAYSMTGSTFSVAANRLSYVFDLHGPSLAVDTACSSSMVALHHACQSLSHGECGSALVGGVNLLLHPYPFVGFTKASMLSAQGRSRAFAEGGDGYVRAEGGAMLLIKPLAKAQADGDRIHAVIRATGNNTDGGRKNGLTIPSGEGQAELLSGLLDKAGLSADDIDYIEAHGTGTAVGDPIETGALGQVLGRARKGTPLPIGSVKSNLGHLEPASGMAGLIKAVLTLKHGQVPPSIHAETLNPTLKLKENRLEVVRAPKRLEATDRPLRVGVNSFGFGGANAHVILESAPATEPAALPVSDTTPALFLSTRSPATIGSLAAAYHDQLDGAPETLPAVAWNAAHRRDWLEQRCAVFGDSPQELIDRLGQLAREPNDPDLRGVVQEKALGAPADIAFVYSGNGAQWLGMGQKLLGESPVFAEAIAEIDALVRQHSDFSLIEELKATPEESHLEDTSVAQPLLFAIQVGLTRLLAGQGITPKTTLGHSVGEVAAAWAAGIYTLEQATELVCHRSRAQAATHGDGRMMAVNLSWEAVQNEIEALRLGDAWIEHAATNAPDQLTLAGDEEALTRLAEHLEDKGVFARVLGLDYAFHSRAMEPIRADLLERLDGLAPASGERRFVSSVTGQVLDGRELTAEYWWDNVRQPVVFEQAVRDLLTAGSNVLVEIGPNAILPRYLTQTIKAAEANARVVSMVNRQADSRLDIEESAHRIHLLAGLSTAACRLPESAPLVDLPLMPFDRKSYWSQPTSEGYSLILRNRVHPLLGYPLREIAHGWENPLDPSVLPYLEDHRVGEAAIMPAAGFAEMAVAAGAMAFDLDAVDIEALEVRQPLIFEPEHGRVLRLILQGDDGRFVIRSRPRLSEDGWTDHAVGRVLGAPTRPVEVEQPANDPPEPPTRLEAKDHYAKARRIGLDYGPAFQGIARIEQAGSRLDTTFALPESVAADTAHHCHPGILDLCFQSLISHPALEVLARRGLTMLPVGIGRLLWHSGGGRAAGCRAEIRRQSPQSILADFALLDEAGQTIAVMERCRFRLAAVARRDKTTPHWRIDTIPTNGLSAVDWPDHQGWQQALATTLEQLNTDPAHQAFLDEARPLLDALLASAAFEAWQHAFGDAPVSHQALSDRTADDLSFDWAHWLADQLVAHGWLTPTDSGWERSEDEPPPPVEAIWQSLLAEYPSLSPELILLGRLGRLLPSLLDPTENDATPLAERLAEAVANSPHASMLRRASLSVAGRDTLTVSAVDALLETVEPGRSLRILQVGGHWLDLADRLEQRLGWHQVELFLTSPQAADREAMQSRYGRDPRVTLAGMDDETGTLDLPTADDLAFDLIVWVDEGMSTGSDAFADSLNNKLAANGRLLVTGVNGAPYWQALMAAATGSAPQATESLPARAEGWASIQTVATATEPGQGSQSGFALLARRETVPTEDAVAAQTGRWAVIGPASSNDPTATVLADDLTRAGASVTRLELEGRPTDIPSFDEVVIAFATTGTAGTPDTGALARLLDWCNQLAKAKRPPRLTWLLPNGAVTHAAGPTDAWNSALWAFGRVVMNEYPMLDLQLIDPGPEATRYADALHHALSRPDDEREVVLRGTSRQALRLHQATTERRPAEANEHFELRFDLPGQLRNLAWRRVDARELSGREVEVAVKAVGLNFRDVMYALGLLGDDIIEDGFSGPTMGLEFAGVVTRTGPDVEDVSVGEEVLGFGPQCFASHVVTHEGAVHPKPTDWSFNEAATVPTVFFTAYYALIELAHLQPGERVLIHGAAGGVGIAAIAIAQQVGAEVFATAGTPEKRNFLEMIGVGNIHDSRSVDFADEILAKTDGGGVDVVLNSLAGEAINRNLHALKPFGRFLELGKRDFVENTHVGLRPFKNNLSYFGIDVDQLMSVRPDVASRVFGEMMTWMKTHEITPLAHRVFAADRVVEAFRYMQQARQIGKVVVSLDTPPMLPAPQPSGQFTVRADGTYVVTGGLAGFGFATARWLLDRGAGEVVAVGRRGADTPGLDERLANLGEAADRLTVRACDVSDGEQVTALIDSLTRKNTTLRGVFHAATVLDDSLLTNLDDDRLETVIAAKAKGAWHLHEATRDLSLDAFVLFSSVTTLLGNPGQGNYVAANGYLDGLAAARRAQGLPATCLNWGPIGDIGMLADNEAVKTGLEARLGAPALTGEQAIAELEAALDQGLSGDAVSPLDWHALARSLPTAESPLFDLVKRTAGPKQQDENDLEALLAELSEPEAKALIGQWIAEEVAEVLGLNAEQIDTQRSLFDIGLDSLMGVELTLALETRLGVRVPTMALSETANIDGLASRLWGELKGDGDEEDDTGRMIRELAEQHETDIDEATLGELANDARAREARRA